MSFITNLIRSTAEKNLDLSIDAQQKNRLQQVDDSYKNQPNGKNQFNETLHKVAATIHKTDVDLVAQEEAKLEALRAGLLSTNNKDEEEEESAALLENLKQNATESEALVKQTKKRLGRRICDLTKNRLFSWPVLVAVGAVGSETIRYYTAQALLTLGWALNWTCRNYNQVVPPVVNGTAPN